MDKRRVSSGRSCVGRCLDSEDCSGSPQVPQRSPVNIDFVADLAAREARGLKDNHPLAARATELLYEAIRKMVYKLSTSYAQSCRVDADDLAQDCLKRIVQRIGDYDSKMSKFTTWSWTVCRSVLNGAYRKHSRWNEHVVSVDVGDVVGDDTPRVEAEQDTILGSDIMNTVFELARMYPRRRKLIMGFFGHPEKKGFVMPSKAMVAIAAKEVGTSYVTANVFYKKVVQPFFRTRFSNVKKGDDISKGVDISTGGMNVVDAAATVLKSIGRTMSARELYKEVVDRKLYVSDAGSPYVSFCSVLGKALLKGDTRINRVSPGMWRAGV